jgi:hypothetical protein
MSSLPLLLTRENLLSYCKDSTEELEKERKKLKDLEWLRENTSPQSPNFWSILIRIRNTRERIDEAKDSLGVYQEMLDVLSIG